MKKIFFTTLIAVMSLTTVAFASTTSYSKEVHPEMVTFATSRWECSKCGTTRSTSADRPSRGKCGSGNQYHNWVRVG